MENQHPSRKKISEGSKTTCVQAIGAPVVSFLMEEDIVCSILKKIAKKCSELLDITMDSKDFKQMK